MTASLKMTREERESFLADRHIGVISVENPGRPPLAAPIWYDFTPAAGVWVVTGASSQKGVALEKAGRFSLVAQQEDMPYKYVSVEGPIVEIRAANRDTDTRAMARRYFGPELGDAYVDSQPDDGSSRVYRMQPERWLTVDYAKVLPG